MNSNPHKIGTYRVDNYSQTLPPITKIKSSWKDNSYPKTISAEVQLHELSHLELRIEDYCNIRGGNLSTKDRHLLAEAKRKFCLSAKLTASQPTIQPQTFNIVYNSSQLFNNNQNTNTPNIFNGNNNATTNTNNIFNNNNNIFSQNINNNTTTSLFPNVNANSSNTNIFQNKPSNSVGTTNIFQNPSQPNTSSTNIFNNLSNTSTGSYNTTTNNSIFNTKASTSNNIFNTSSNTLNILNQNNNNNVTIFSSNNSNTAVNNLFKNSSPSSNTQSVNIFNNTVLNQSQQSSVAFSHGNMPVLLMPMASQDYDKIIKTHINKLERDNQLSIFKHTLLQQEQQTRQQQLFCKNKGLGFFEENQDEKLNQFKEKATKHFMKVYNDNKNRQSLNPENKINQKADNNIFNNIEGYDYKSIESIYNSQNLRYSSSEFGKSIYEQFLQQKQIEKQINSSIKQIDLSRCQKIQIKCIETIYIDQYFSEQRIIKLSVPQYRNFSSSIQFTENLQKQVILQAIHKDIIKPLSQCKIISTRIKYPPCQLICNIYSKTINLPVEYTAEYESLEKDTVRKLRIKNSFGELFWQKIENVSKIDFSNIIEITQDSIYLYKHSQKPQKGKGLNKNMILTLFQCKIAQKLRDKQQYNKAIVIQKLMKICSNNKFEFCSYNENNDHWQIKILPS